MLIQVTTVIVVSEDKHRHNRKQSPKEMLECQQERNLSIPNQNDLDLSMTSDDRTKAGT